MIKKFRTKFSNFRQTDRKVHWILDELKWRYFTFRHRKQLPLNIAFDREYNVETAPELPLESVGAPLADVARGNGIYRPVSEKLFRAAIAAVGIDAAKFTFLDIGSGMGKALFMAADHPFKRIVGIEYARGLHEVALRNVATYRSNTQRCNLIEPVHADALEYELPDGPLVLFIFNALAKDIMRKLLTRLDAGAAAEEHRPVVLIYTNVRTVREVGGVFSGLHNLHVVRRVRNFVVIANEAARTMAARRATATPWNQVQSRGRREVRDYFTAATDNLLKGALVALLIRFWAGISKYRWTTNDNPTTTNKNPRKLIGL
jgi:SAM-dependent methyltransferase